MLRKIVLQLEEERKELLLLICRQVIREVNKYNRGDILSMCLAESNPAIPRDQDGYLWHLCKMC